MRKAITVLALTALGGCTSLPGERPGSYSYTVAPDGSISVDSRTLRGGPDIKITRQDGSTVEIGSSNEQVITELLKTLK